MTLRPPPRRLGPVATLLSLLTLACLGVVAAPGCSPPPFNPKDGCSQLSSSGCIQCASRGGCGWCASACVAVEGATCSSGLVQDPTFCPGAVPSASASAAAP